MFTGIVEEVGAFSSRRRRGKGFTIKVGCEKVHKNASLGDSIAVNGVCLTVTKLMNKGFEADVMEETVNRTNLGKLKRGSRVNLESALALGDKLGGHLVSGHIHGMGRIAMKKKNKVATVYTIETGQEILSGIVEKGSIAVDGVSLTVVEKNGSFFSVSVIPHSRENTLFSSYKIGTEVNLEKDVIGSYVNNNIEELSRKGRLSESFLRENGF